LREYLEKMGIKPVDSEIYAKIDDWLAWYCGKSKAFHNYVQYNGKKKIKRERASLCMAKRVCEDWANLLLNEKVEITTSSEAATKLIRQVLSDNNFRVLGNRLVEIAFALGIGAFVEYIDAGRVKIDYIRADMIFPISYSGGEITECAFCSEKLINGKKCAYIQAHIIENGVYVIKNRLFDTSTSLPLPLPQGMKDDFVTGLKTALLFQIVTPNIVNSAEIGSCFGMSVYSDAIDILKGIDLVYDSYCNEFRLGKKRIVVPVSMSQMIMGDGGAMNPVFDDNDVEFYALSDDSTKDLKEINMAIRSNEHRDGLQEQLNLLSVRCGLGTHRYSYEPSGVKTATEVISEQSSMFQNLKKHELVLSAVLTKLSKAILFLLGVKDNPEISIDFDDSIIHDTSAEFTQKMQLVAAGLMLPYEFRMWWFGESEEQAKKALAEAAPEDDGGGDE